jgi:hypothetical protein
MALTVRQRRVRNGNRGGILLPAVRDTEGSPLLHQQERPVCVSSVESCAGGCPEDLPVRQM